MALTEKQYEDLIEQLSTIESTVEDMRYDLKKVQDSGDKSEDLEKLEEEIGEFFSYIMDEGDAEEETKRFLHGVRNGALKETAARMEYLILSRLLRARGR